MGFGILAEPAFVGESAKMQQIRRLVSQIADKDLKVVILGETGTGKELVARMLHLRAPSSSYNFVPVNCAGIPEGLLESDLFGHEKGSFTGAYKDQPGKFQVANNGTLLLDEIGDMTLPLQAKILRALDSGEITRVGATTSELVNARVLAASNKDLRSETRAGRFREDLFHRLSEATICMPPLRERTEDLESLTKHFCQEFSPSPRVFSVESDCYKDFVAYDWPGNVRELRNLVKRAILLYPEEGEHVTLRHQYVRDMMKANTTGTVLKDNDKILPNNLKDLERHVILEALRNFNNVQKDAAKYLGLSPRVINYKMKTLGIRKGPDGRYHGPAENSQRQEPRHGPYDVSLLLEMMPKNSIYEVMSMVERDLIKASCSNSRDADSAARKLGIDSKEMLKSMTFYGLQVKFKQK